MLQRTYQESNGSSTTTSLTWQTKVSLTIPAATGTVRVSYTLEYNSGSNNKSVAVRCYNSTDAVVLGSNQQQTNNSANYYSFTGFAMITMTGASKTIDLQYTVITSGNSCTVQNARLESWRLT